MSTTSSDSYSQREFNQSRRSLSRSLSNSSSSWRTLSSSRTLDSVREAIRNSKHLNSETKLRLKTVYKDYELGKISRETLKMIVQKDLKLETNESFERSLKSVNMSYTSLVRGIEKREINLMTNFKPNTKDEQLAKQNIKTVSLNLYQAQRNPYQISNNTIEKPKLVSDEEWLQKQLDKRIPNQKLFLPEQLLAEDEKERLQVAKEYRLGTLSHKTRNTVSYKVKGAAPEGTQALKNNGDIVNLKTETIKNSQQQIPGLVTKNIGLKKVPGQDRNKMYPDQQEWSKSNTRTLTQLNTSSDLFNDQENNPFYFKTTVSSARSNGKFSNLKQLHSSFSNIISWE